MILTQGIFAFLPIDLLSKDEMKVRARRVILNGELRPEGHSETRYLSYLAGRTAVSEIFHSIGLNAVVSAAPFFGYLTIQNHMGQPITDLFVTISHTEEVAIAVVMPEAVGVDVEKVDRDSSRVLGRILTPQESQNLPPYLEVPGGRVPSGILAWSAKEAVSKATGLGIKFGLKNFIINFSIPQPFPVRLGIEGPVFIKDAVVLALRREDWIITICTPRTMAIHPLKEITINAAQFR